MTLIFFTFLLWCFEKHGYDKGPDHQRLGCFDGFRSYQQTDVFIAFLTLFFSMKEMDVNKGEGMHINPFSHPFHSSKRLRLQCRDKVIRLQIIPQIQQKARQTAKPCRNHPAHWSLFTKSVAELPVFTKTGYWKNIWSCFYKSVIPAAVEQQGIYSFAQRGKRTMCFCGFALKKKLPHLLYFLANPPSFLPFYFFIPLLLIATLLLCGRKQKKYFSPTQCCNVFQLFVSPHIFEPNANVCCTLSFASRPLKKCVLKSVGNPRKKKSVKKSRIKSDKTCSCSSEHFSPLEQRRCEAIVYE